ncbi:tRNA 2-thiouridine(34) synthase MnmA [Candidatus Dojkabacteria bacterium]|nr:tRNA 2-thiouridine(34) synthase MnmA [Candidatus Dojkabacteria bacterium]
MMTDLSISKQSNVFVAMSGGIDSSTSAYLLKDAGFIVTGLFMETGYTSQEDKENAQKVCDFLKVPLKTIDLSKEFQAKIVENFISEYSRGRTPNPCVLCNEKIKFGLLFDKALETGAEYIATGHYARKRTNKTGSFDLLRGLDPKKDQSYFLYRITQKQLSKTIFPVGDLTKENVKKIATQKNLPVKARDESQDICFLKRNKLNNTLLEDLAPHQGRIIDIDTKKEVGAHQGVWNFTLGQREGIRVGGTEQPYFVAKIDAKSNTLYVAKGKENPSLFSDTVAVDQLTWINKTPSISASISASTRYRQIPVPCKIADSKIKFLKPLWAPTPGQSLVIFDKEMVLGGGIIETW